MIVVGCVEVVMKVVPSGPSAVSVQRCVRVDSAVKGFVAQVRKAEAYGKSDAERVE